MYKLVGSSFKYSVDHNTSHRYRQCWLADSNDNNDE